MPRTPPRVSSFNRRYIVWWLAGAQKPTSVEFPTRRLATSVRHDLYSLRKALRVESHYAAALADKAQVIHHPVNPEFNGLDDPYILTIRPAGANIDLILDAAGIEDPSLEPEPHQDLQGQLRQLSGPPPAASTSLDYSKLMQPSNNEENEEETT